MLGAGLEEGWRSEVAPTVAVDTICSMALISKQLFPGANRGMRSLSVGKHGGDAGVKSSLELGYVDDASELFPRSSQPAHAISRYHRSAVNQSI